MTGYEYTASMITVVSFSETVRKYPRMYFRHSRDSPDLVLGVARALICDAYYPRNNEPVDVELVIEADRRWTVTDNGTGTGFGEDGLPPEGFFGSLVHRDRGPLASVVSVSTRARVEVWQDGRTWWQELRDANPVGPPQPGPSREGRGTRATVELDAGFFPTDAVLPDDTSVLLTDYEGKPLSVPGNTLTIVDRRGEGGRSREQPRS